MGMILSDVGGTNIRFARVNGLNSPLKDITRFKCSEFTGIEEAFATYQKMIGCNDMLDAVSIAVAASVNKDHVDLTNNHWAFSKSELRAHLTTNRLLVMNDFTAQALAQSDPTAHGNLTIIAGEPKQNAPLLIIGPGTGLGVSALIPTATGMLPLEGEGGHVSFAPRSEAEQALYEFIRRTEDYVSAEHVLSGSGLEAIYRFLTCDNPDAPEMNAPKIGAAAVIEPGPCRDAVVMMLNILGTVIANNVLTIGAWGGVVVAGGIVSQLVSIIDQSQLVNRIQKIGKESHLTTSLPVWLSVDPQAGLRGAQAGLSCEFLAGRELRA